MCRELVIRLVVDCWIGGADGEMEVSLKNPTNRSFTPSPTPFSSCSLVWCFYLPTQCQHLNKLNVLHRIQINSVRKKKHYERCGAHTHTPRTHNVSAAVIEEQELKE